MAALKKELAHGDGQERLPTYIGRGSAGFNRPKHEEDFGLKS